MNESRPASPLETFETVGQIQALIEAFESGHLPKARWTHHAHLIVGLWYITHHGHPGALPVVRQRIRAFNEAVGTANTDTGGYHETLTRFFLGGIAGHLARHPGVPLADLASSLLRSPMADKDWPLTRYTRERLFSVTARLAWVEPDLPASPMPPQ